MSSILHFDKVLVRSFMLTVLVLVCMCVFIAAQCPLIELVIVLGLSTERHRRSLVHIPFGYTTQSTAGPGIDSVHKCHHHKHSQSRHVDAPAGFCYHLKTVWHSN